MRPSEKRGAHLLNYITTWYAAPIFWSKHIFPLSGNFWPHWTLKIIANIIPRCDFWDAFIYFPLSSSLLCTTGRVALYMSTYEHRRAEVSLCKLAHIYPSTLAYFLALHIMWHNFIAFLFHSTSLFAQSYQKKTSKVLFAQFPFLAHRLPLH